MQQTVEKFLRRYGSDIRVRSGEQTVQIRAFLQPVTGRGQNMAQIGVSPLGREAAGQYIYIGPLEPAVAEGDGLELDGREYILRRTEQINGVSGPVYRWGMCVEKGAEDTWGLNG